MKTILFVAVIFALLLSCSESHSGSDSYYYTAENYTGIELELQNADFSCPVAADCPNNVGLLFSNIDGNSYNPRIAQCTGFLVGDDIIATNSHCIPDRLKSPGIQCDSQIAIRFIDPSAKKNIFHCKMILSYSPIDLFDPDYAFLRIEQTGKQPFVIHKDGLKDNESIRIPRVNPLSHSIGGRLETEFCRIGLGTLLNPKGTNSWSKTAVGLGCEVQNGNSGSPVLNSQGKIVGILQRRATEKYRRVLMQNFSTFELKVPDKIIPHMIFTSLSCIADPITNGYNREKCSYGENLSITECIDFNNEKSIANNQLVYDQWKNDLPSIFVYEFEIDEKTLTAQAQPICVKPKDKSVDYQRYISLDGIFGLGKEHLNLTYSHEIEVGASFNVDFEFHLEPELDFVVKSRSNYVVDLIKENDKWVGNTWMGRKYSRGFNSTDVDAMYFNLELIDHIQAKTPMSLSECTEQQLNAEEVLKVVLANGEIVTEQEYEQREKTKKREKKICEK